MMNLVAFIAIGILLLWLIAYQQAGAKVWFSVAAGWSVLLALIPQTHWLPALLLVTFSAIILVIVWHAEFRKQYLSLPLLKQFKRVIPVMSETEKQAIASGSVWWDGELFSGKPDWDYLLSYPDSRLSDEEQQFLQGSAEQLCGMLDDWRITQQDFDLPEEVWTFMRQQRFFGMIIPKCYGGLDFSNLAHSNVVMKLASRSITAAITVMVPNSLGPAKLLLKYGTQKQKDYYLPRLADGRELPCFALTSPVAGSDAGSINDSGEVCYGNYNGAEVLGIKLDFNKRYITLAPVASLIGLAVKLYDPQQLLSDEQERGITVVLIAADTAGIEQGNRHMPMSMPFQNGPLRGRDVFVPLENVIGGLDGIGRGWQMLVECLSEGRAISLPALATGAGKMACRYTGAYAKIRQQFNLPIGQFEGVQEALARIAALTYQMDAARKLTLSALDQDERPAVISAIIKYQLTEKYRQVVNDAMDIQGGSGICLGPANLIGRAYQSIPISITVEGANILTRNMIIFGQGAIRCHPWILTEIEATQKPLSQAIDEFDHAVTSHLSYLLGNFARTFFLGLSRGRLSATPALKPTRRYFQYLNWMSAAFALTADIAMMTLGGSLKRKERLSARLADVLSELYLCSAVLRYFHLSHHQQDDAPLLAWSMQQSLYNMQESLRSLFRNLPYKPLGHLLKLLVFPSGLPFVKPSDLTSHQAALLLLRPSASREQLTDGIYHGHSDSDKASLLEKAFLQADRVSEVESTLRAARKAGVLTGDYMLENARQAAEQKLISSAELNVLLLADQYRQQVTQVDDFHHWGSDAADGNRSDNHDHAA